MISCDSPRAAGFLHACACISVTDCHDATSIMSTRNWLSVGGAIVLGAAVGFLGGRKSAPVQKSNGPIAENSGEKLRPARQKKSVDGDETRAVSQALSSTDFETELKKISSGPSRKRWERMRDLARSVSPADATNALALAEKILPRQEWWNFRHNLLEKWAESDPQAVLAYGQTLKSRNDRRQAISTALMVLR